MSKPQKDKIKEIIMLSRSIVRVIGSRQCSNAFQIYRTNQNVKSVQVIVPKVGMRYFSTEEKPKTTTAEATETQGNTSEAKANDNQTSLSTKISEESDNYEYEPQTPGEHVRFFIIAFKIHGIIHF